MAAQPHTTPPAGPPVAHFTGYGPVTATTPRPETVTDPDAYGVSIASTAGMPTELRIGDVAIFSPAAPIEPGVLVALWPANGGRPYIRRLQLAPLWPVGSKLHPESEAVPAVIVEAPDGVRSQGIPIDRLRAMHAMVAVQRGRA